MLHENLRVRRLNLKMTLKNLSDLVGISTATLSKYETGNISNIDTKTIVKLAKALDCEPAQLMGWVPLPSDNVNLDKIMALCHDLDTQQLELITTTIESYRKIWAV